MMKKLYFLILAAATAFAAQAQTPITIAAARALPLGTTVTVAGIVTSGNELDTRIRYIQDATGGIPAYSTSASIPPNNIAMSAINIGDSVKVTGVLKNYQNLLEIDPVSNIQVLATNKPLPAPIEFSAANLNSAFAEQYEGRLVKFNGVTSVTTTTGAAFSTFAGATTYRVNGVAGQDLRVSANSTGTNGVVGKPRPTGTFSVVGIMGQFMANYQIQPRFYSDFVLGNAPNIASAVVPTNITTNSLTITFQTQNPGSATLTYGTTPAMGQTINASGQNTSHSINLTGLQPATVYYVQATVTNPNGTSSTSVLPVITASQSSGSIKVYFNRPVNNSYALPGNPAVYVNNRMPDTIINYINRAKYTIDLAAYSFGINPIAQALNAAQARGVQVRFIGDASTASSAISALNSAIPRVLRPNGVGIMHNKFMAIDAFSTNPNDAVLMTGGMNLTYGQTNSDPNVMLFVQDQSLAKVYTMEFNEIWGSSTMTPGTATFGASKTDNTPHHVMVGGRLVETYFSPSDNVNTKLIETINSADNDFEFATMLITRGDVAAAIRNKFQQGGNISLCSGGIMNDTVGASGPWFTMQGVMGNRLQKYSGTNIMHHKYMMVDAGAPMSDPQIFVGSHNWSNSANNTNDENTLIIHDYYVVNLFYQEWVQRMQDQNAGISICNTVLGAPEAAANPANRISVYPNPNRGEFFVQLGSPATQRFTIRVVDVTGRVVSEQQVTPQQALEPVAVRTASLRSGLYAIQLIGEGISATGRVVIE